MVGFNPGRFRGAGRLQGIAAFVNTVEAGNFTEASVRMRLSRSAAAKSVRRLEEELGTQLLHRTTRTVTTTPEGAAFYERCVRILEELDEAESLLKSINLEVSGDLKVSLPVSFGRLWVLPTLLKLGEDNPSLKLQVSFTDRFVDLYEEGVDLAVRIGDTPDSASLMTRKLSSQMSVICAAPSYLDRKGTPGSIEDLAQHDCILFSQGGSVAPWRLAEGHRQVREVSVRAGHVIGHGEAMLDSVLAGHGLARLATWLIHGHVESGRLRIVLPETQTEDHSIQAIWPFRRDSSPKVRAGVRALVQAFSPMAPWSSSVTLDGSARPK